MNLQEIKNLGVRELSVSNGQAVAVNPYDAFMETCTKVSYPVRFKEFEDKLKNLPPLPCAESVKEGTYPIGAFEEGYQELDEDGYWVWCTKEIYAHRIYRKSVLVLSEPVAETEGFKEYVCTNCKHVNMKKDNGEIEVGLCGECEHPLWNDEVAEKPEGGSLERESVINLYLHDNLGTFTEHSTPTEAVESAEEVYMRVQKRLIPKANNYTLPENWEIEAMEEYASLRVAQEKADEWISVNDRLPEDKQNTICFSSEDIPYNPYHNIIMSSYSKKYGFESAGINITHWMPLPKQPKVRVAQALKK